MWRFAVLLVPLLGGCIVIPVPHPESPHPSTGRAEVEPQDAAFIRVGATTREDVLCALGEPDFWWAEERVMVYQWTMTNLHVILFVWGLPEFFQADIPIERYLVVRFGGTGRVERFEFSEARGYRGGEKYLRRLRDETS